MGDYLSNLTPQRIITIVVCVGLLVLWFRFKWSRTCKYVNSRNELFSDHYKKLNEYSLRVMTDPRWSGFLSKMQNRCSVVVSGTPGDDQTYCVHYCCIWDSLGKQYEPGETGSENASFTAYLKRSSKPRYIQFDMSPAGEISESKVGGSSWYDMFEKSV